MSLVQQCEGLPRPVRRVIALVAVPALLVASVLVLYAPVRYLSGLQNDWRATTRSVMAQARSVPVLAEELNRQLTTLQSSGLWVKFYPSKEPGAAAGALQSDLSGILAGAQISAQSLAPIATGQLPYFTRIGTRLTASMRVDQLQRLLTSIANHPRYLRVEQATIVAPQSQSPEENPPLAVTLEIYGYELPDGQQSATSELPLLALEHAR